MPNSKLCEIVVVLDRSGSMATIQKDMCGGFNQFVKDQRAVPGECNLTLVQFDSESIDTVYENCPIAKVGDLVLEPRGGTPLLDAIGKTIVNVGARLRALPEDKRPGKVIFFIISDGEENSSREYSYSLVKSMIDEQTNKYSWNFSYLGANVDAFAVGQSLGIAVNAIADYCAAPAAVAATYRSMSRGVAACRTTGQSLSYTQEEREAMAEDDTTVGTSSK